MIACTPRAKNAATTRQLMLAAATRRFLQESYENVGLRDIAGEAGIDVALVSRYFGSKEGLFGEVLRGCDGGRLPAGMRAGELPRYLADVALGRECADGDGSVERLMIILRSASSPKAAEIVRSTLREDVLQPIADLLEGENAGARASLSLALWIGTTILRSIMTVEPLCEANRELVHRKLVKLFEAALSPV